jgi:DNA-directed RNA polymerase specialized sigma24 family protein
MPTERIKKNWTINAEAFQRLLEWLDDGKNSDGAGYLEIRGRLVSFFDRKNCLNPDELADETLNRVARRLVEEAGAIESETPAKYCYIVAKFVFLESLRAKDKNTVSLDEITENKLFSPESDEKIIKETRLNCLDHCTNNLEIANREIIFGYYFGEERIKIENRRTLAKKFDISVNALSIRACRIREKLQVCVEKCVGKDTVQTHPN